MITFDFAWTRCLYMFKIDPVARQRVNELAKHARRFPNVGIAGHYDPFTQVITLDSIEERHLKLIAEQHDFATKKAYFPLLAHELRHWFDHVGTVWFMVCAQMCLLFQRRMLEILKSAWTTSVTR